MLLKSYQKPITWPSESDGEVRKWRVKPNMIVKQGDELVSVLATSRLHTVKAPDNGIIESILIREGSLCPAGSTLAILNACKHDVVHGGVCATCAASVDSAILRHSSLPTGQMASVSVKHELAEERHQQLVDRLLASRKLYLVLDLDLTVLQAMIEKPGDAEKIEAYRQAGIDIKEFMLDSHKYYIKFRPGIKEFLNEIAEHFDVHVYTLGQRSYAENITRMLDEFIDNPSKKLFKDGYSRIMTRSETHEMESKNLKHVLQKGDQIAVIIDDREEVWRQSIGNLLPAKPYDFFKGHGDINDPNKLKSAATGSSTEKSEEWISPVMQNLIAEGKIPKPEGYEEKLKRQEEREKEKRGIKRLREEPEEGDPDSPLAKYAKMTQESSKQSAAKPTPSITPLPVTSFSTLSKPGSLSLSSSIDLKSKLKSLPSLKKAKVVQEEEKDSSSSSSGEGEKELTLEKDTLPRENDENRKEKDVVKDGEKEEVNEKTEIMDEGSAREEGAVKEESGIDTSSSPPPSQVHKEEVQEKVDNKSEKRDEIFIPEDDDAILFSMTRALKKVHKLFFEEYDRTRILPDVKRAIDTVRRDTFRNCCLTFSHLIPTGADLKKDRTWTRSQWFGATCSLELKLGTTTHLVCGKAGTDKLHTALKSTQPIFIVNRQWLYDSMDHFQRQDESKYHLVDDDVNPPMIIPTRVGGIPRIGLGNQSVDSGDGDRISSASSHSVGASLVSTSSKELEHDMIDDMDIDESPPQKIKGEEGEEDEDAENVINFDDISSDLSDEEEAHNKNEANDEPDENDEGIDPGVMKSFFSDVYRLAKKGGDEDLPEADDDQDRYPEDEYDEENMGPASDEGDLDYGDNAYFEDDDEGGDY